MQKIVEQNFPKFSITRYVFVANSRLNQWSINSRCKMISSKQLNDQSASRASSGGDCIPTPQPRPARPHPPSFRRWPRDAPISRRVCHRDQNRAHAYKSRISFYFTKLSRLFSISCLTFADRST